MPEILRIWFVLAIILSVCCYMKPKDEMTGGGSQYMSVEGMYRTRIPLSGTTRCFSCELDLLAQRGISPYLPLPY